jgi:ATP-dependent RNA helicase DeaD
MKREVDRLSEHLLALGFSVGGLHGDIEQIDRERIIKAYRRAEIKIMVATDIAARGLDIKDISHVFNYHIPFDPQSYVHRIGRTGRAGKSGQAITLVSTEEFRELKRIQKEVGADMEFSTINNESGLNANDYEVIARKIRLSDINPKISHIIEHLEDMGIEDVVKKAISIIINSEATNSSTQIGYDYSSVKNMIDNLDSEKKATRNNNRRKKR